MKTLREMYPDGVYTDNSPEVFTRFKELLGGDYEQGGEINYDCAYSKCGLDAECSMLLSQYNQSGFGDHAVYLTNEEFFTITLEPEIQAVDLDDELGFDLVEELEESNISVGQLIKQLQQSTRQRSPEVCISDSGKIILFGDVDDELDVTEKSGEEIDEIYYALVVLMNV